MRTGLQLQRVLAGILLLSLCLAGTAGAAQLGNEWKVRSSGEDGSFLGVQTTPDASLIFAGGNSILIRSWNGDIRWGNRPARVAALSLDARRVVLGTGNKLTMFDNKGNENWSRTMDGYVRTLVISPNGSFTISADDKGNYRSWGRDGEPVASLKNQTANALAYSPSTNLIVAATDSGLIFLNRKLDVEWIDNRTESRDAFLAISGDGGTVIAAGYNQVASYDSDGTLNWRKEVTKEPIIDMHTSLDCSAIIVGGQDKEVVAIDQYGNVRWRYSTGQWVNAIGVSRDASVIAAGGIDRTVYVFDRSGTLITKRLTDAIIQPRSIAVSSDGKRVVVADQRNLYGFTLLGDAVAPEITLTSTVTPLNPVETPNPTTRPATPEITEEPEYSPEPTLTPGTSVPVRPATYSPVNPALALPALGAAFLLLRKRR